MPTLRGQPDASGRIVLSKSDKHTFYKAACALWVCLRMLLRLRLRLRLRLWLRLRELFRCAQAFVLRVPW